MVCKNCKKEPYFENLCRNCFTKSFEKKSRKEIRGIFEKDSKIYIESNNDSNTYALNKFLNSLGHPLKYTSKKVANFILIPWSLENEVLDFLEHFLMGDINKIKKDIGMRVFKNLTQKEIDLYAISKGYKSKAKKLIHISSISKMIEELELKYPGIKKAVLNGVKEYKAILNK